jgi:hypothetical protein
VEGTSAGGRKSDSGVGRASGKVEVMEIRRVISDPLTSL